MTQIRFALVAPENVGVNIYDVSGQLVRALHRGSLGRGHHNVWWDGMDQQGRRVNSGIYFSLVQAGAEKLTRKIVVVR